MTEPLSNAALTDLWQRVLQREQPSLEKLALAARMIRVGYTAAATARNAKAKKKSGKAASGGKGDIAAIFGDGGPNEPAE